MGKLDRLTVGAYYVLENAASSTQLFKHNYLGTEHLLLGLLDFRQGAAFGALSAHGVTSEKVIDLVDDIIGRGQYESTTSKPWTPRAKRVEYLAQVQADQLNQASIGPEHYLLALIHEAEQNPAGLGVAGQIFRRLNVDLRQLRQMVILLIVAAQLDDETSGDMSLLVALGMPEFPTALRELRFEHGIWHPDYLKGLTQYLERALSRTSQQLKRAGRQRSNL